MPKKTWDFAFENCSKYEKISYIVNKRFVGEYICQDFVGGEPRERLELG